MYKIWPAIKLCFTDIEESKWENLPQQLREEINNNQVNANHLATVSANLKTTLGQYMTFMKEHKERQLLKVDYYDVLADKKRLKAFLDFFNIRGNAPSTIRNKASKYILQLNLCHCYLHECFLISFH